MTSTKVPTLRPSNDGLKVEQMKRTLTHALDMLDIAGVSGTVAICLLPGGGHYLKAAGACQDATGMACALFTAIAAFRDKLSADGDTEAAEHFTRAAHALAPLVFPKAVDTH